MPKQRTTEEARIYAREWREKNREKSNNYSQSWYQRHKDDVGFKEKQAVRNKDWRAANQEIDRKRQRVYRRNKPEQFSAYQIRKNYGVSLEEAKRLHTLREQGCQVCVSKVRTVIDHCHLTGRIRGILCDGCNKAIGMVKENPEILEALALYLRTDVH